MSSTQVSPLDSSQAVLVDGVMTEDPLTLRDGAVETIVPRPEAVVGDEPRRATLPAIRDEDLFQEYTEALMARRRSVDTEEGPSA